MQPVALRPDHVGTAGTGATFARDALHGAGACHRSTRRQRPGLRDPDALPRERLPDPRFQRRARILSLILIRLRLYRTRAPRPCYATTLLPCCSATLLLCYPLYSLSLIHISSLLWSRSRHATVTLASHGCHADRVTPRLAQKHAPAVITARSGGPLLRTGGGGSTGQLLPSTPTRSSAFFKVGKFPR